MSKGLADQEHLAKNIIEIYRKHGPAWTALRGKFLYEKDWLDKFLALLPKRASILDLGCGAATTLGTYLIAQGHNLTGIDSAECMIEMAQQNFPQHIWLHQDMRSIELHQTFDGILAWDSFFHLTPADQETMFGRFARHAKVGTVLMFTSGTSHGEAIGDMFGDALYHASLAPDEYEGLLNHYGFEVINRVAEDANCAGHTVWLAQRFEIRGEE
ncbi:class I SAM-dependent methyltransferase [Acinetobacter populi]|uniref:SAM-dependent methyltransferase n=1 Tax=Acinetobacter populi TaxID=1582270 RepID=A0A1Z9YTM7_9GAMM|nr:class I SAM-dependent methyltransferase [Acinetobacter populi]OUY05582.1 SAM-dependent methyltransferase [Acinetobacter populi]